MSAKSPYSRQAKVKPWLIAGCLIFLVSLVTIAFVPGWLQWLPIMLAAISAFLSVILLLPLYWVFGGVDQIIGLIVADPWLHWQFPESQWREWASSRLAAERKPGRWLGRTGLIILAAIVTALIAGVLLKSSPAGLALLVVANMALGLFLIVALATGLTRLLAGQKYRRLLVASPDVYIGLHGVLLGNEFMPFALYSQTLTGAGIEGSDLVLRFLVSTNRGKVPSTEYVPIPAEAEEDLGLLQQRLTRHYPEAHIELV